MFNTGVRGSGGREMTISVAMGTYNGERFLGEQLASLAAQTRLPDELVVTDDGSTDRTLEIVNEFGRTAPFPVRVVRNDTNLGYGDNFLKAARACRSDWIAFCDQDDIWLPDKLSAVERHFQVPGRDVVLVVHDALVVDQSLRPSGVRYPGIGRSRVRKGVDLPMLWFAGGLTMVFKADLVRRCGSDDRGPGHGPSGDPLAHDAWICWLACIVGDVALSSDALVLYRRHPRTTTRKLTGNADEIRASRRRFAVMRHALTERGAATYLRVSEALACHASAFRRIARDLGGGAWRDRFLDAERRYRSAAIWLAERGATAGEETFARRIRHFRRAIAAGGYWTFYGAQRWLGMRALARDALNCLIGGRRLARMVGGGGGD